MRKIIISILCFFKHKWKRNTFNCWCSRCGIGETWNGTRWIRSNSPHCVDCGYTVDSQKWRGNDYPYCPTCEFPPNGFPPNKNANI